MDPLVILVAALVYIEVMVVTVTLVGDEGRARLAKRVRHLAPQPQRTPLAEKLSLPFAERILAPAAARVVRFVGGLAPAETLASAHAELERGGHPLGLTAASFVTLRAFSAVGGVAAAIWFWRSPLIGDNGHLPLAGLALTVGLLAPMYILQKAIEGRHAQIRRALPDVIDLLVVSVEAGSGLDGALAEVVSRKEGPLVDEFQRLLGEVRVGKTRRQAWQDMAERVGEDHLSALVAALTHAEQLGVSIAKALRAQADSLRTTRSLQVREAAAALPVKMLFPLIFFIFPALFVILLGPGLMSVTKILGVLSGQ
ncbi:MAG: type II secretion system F family protein [Armatimonadota bacterium]